MATYPGLSKTVQQVFEAVGRGANPTQFYDRIVVRRAQFYHRVNVAAAAAASLIFFNTTPTPGTTNWNQAGLPLENGFWLRSLRFVPEGDNTLAGAVTANAEELDDALAATPVAWTFAEQVRRMFQQGIVNLTVGTRKIVDSQFGLENFPQGSGLDIMAAGLGGTTTATNIGAAAVINNGIRDASNTYDLGWIPVLPQKPVNLTVDWLASTPSVGVQFVIGAVLDGWLIYPQSL